MIEKIIEGSARNKFLVFLMVIFLGAWGLWALKNTPLDAIPDLSDVQVIIYTPWMGRNPTIIEDQVTYPIVTTMISAPRVKSVRGFSDFGYSYVYIIFEDGTDIYWARSRVLEYLNQASGRLPSGVTPTLGPDASGVGWVFQYALIDESRKYDLAQLRSLQDWYLRYQIGSVEGVGGIVVMRHGENALNLIDRVKQKIKEIEPALPSGVKIVSTYDRSDLILRSIATLKEKLIEESLIVSLVIVIFLFHVRSALVVIITLPIAIILSFIAIYYLNLTSNIMSLGGIAIAIGAMVDAAIVMVENAHKRLEHWEEAGRPGDRTQVLIDSAKEVGKPLFFSLLIITVSFLPIFTLEAQEGRLFQPLAFTKTFAMFFAAFLSITLVPVLMVLLIRGRIRPETRNPINRLPIALYAPIVRDVLRFQKTTITLAVIALILTYPAFARLGSEFMPPLNEGMIFYMPTTLPGISVTQSPPLVPI